MNAIIWAYSSYDMGDALAITFIYLLNAENAMISDAMSSLYFATWETYIATHYY